MDPVKMQRVFDDLSKIPLFEKFREKEMKQQVKKLKTERESRYFRA
jgi:hypothetical protein